MGIMNDYLRRFPMKRIAAPPYGWEHTDEEFLERDDIKEHLESFTGEENVAGTLMHNLWHGTHVDLIQDIEQNGIKAQQEWGLGRQGVFVWRDRGSAVNWANYWYGYYDEGAIVEIDKDKLTEIYPDTDEGNKRWYGTGQSMSYIVPNDIPPDAIVRIVAGEDFSDTAAYYKEQYDKYGSYLLFDKDIGFLNFVEPEQSDDIGWAERV